MQLMRNMVTPIIDTRHKALTALPTTAARRKEWMRRNRALSRIWKVLDHDSPWMSPSFHHQSDGSSSSSVAVMLEFIIFNAKEWDEQNFKSKSGRLGTCISKNYNRLFWFSNIQISIWNTFQRIQHFMVMEMVTKMARRKMVKDAAAGGRCWWLCMESAWFQGKIGLIGSLRAAPSSHPP